MTTTEVMMRDDTTEGYDPDVLMKKIQEMYETMPPGWTKNPNPGVGSRKAPFIHEDGRESWKHPGRNEMQKVIQQMTNAGQQRQVEGGSGSGGFSSVEKEGKKPLLKRYRMMLRSGVPLKAVEQRASLEGVDPALIATLLEDDDDSHHDSDRNGSNTNSCSRHLKKYRKMIKAGIPMRAVQQTADRDGVDITELISSSADAKEGINDSISSPGAAAGRRRRSTIGRFNNNNKNNLKKYRMMIKAGIPMTAVQQAADMDGVDILELTNACPNSTTATSSDAAAAAKEEKEVQGHNYFFTPDLTKQQVRFPGNTNLTRLVQKVVQTIQKRAKASATSKDQQLMVELRVLYHALGSLRGVQHSRNVYNSTTADNYQSNKKLSILEIRSKRKAFLELAQSLTMPIPKDLKRLVDIEGLDELVSFIETTYQSELDSIQNQMMNVGLYDFDSLGQIYQPGSRVVATNAFAGGIPTICEVVWNRYEQGKTLFGVTKTFRVCFQFVVAIGNHFTLVESVEFMESFDGKRSIQSLEFVPLASYPTRERDRLEARLASRGKVYSKVATSENYMQYDKGSFYAKNTAAIGRNKSSSSNNTSAALHSGGRLMVDIQGAYEAGHSLGTGQENMVMGIKYKYKEYMLQMRSQKEQAGGTHHHDVVGGGGGMVLFDTVPEDYLSMTWPAVVGFSFHSKVWGDVLVDGIQEIDFQDNIFDKIVLPAARKRMVRALVKHSCDAFNDVVRGKGEGSVFLLYGAPGVGKTLTAEAVCELLHKPLYTVSLGQLGSTAADLETNLNSILTLCARWDALILLDEADIFLEKRSSTGSLERNAMVSVMLRLVEYFKGVLFLTSNRIDSLDPAFKTRITLALRYEALDEKARNQVWINLLETSGFGQAVKDGSIDTTQLAKHVLNGREIKNSIRLAMALAEEDGEPLSQKFLLETVDILNEFNEQMESAESYDSAGFGKKDNRTEAQNSSDC